MIFLEQTVNQILREEGQVIISLDDLQITWEDLEGLFCGVYEQAKQYINIYDWTTDYLNTNPQERDYSHIKHITYSNATYMQRFMPDVPDGYWEYNPFTHKGSSLMASNFSLEVGKYPSLEHLDYDLSINLKKERKHIFTLPCSFYPEDFKFEDMIAFEDRHKIILEGDNIFGEFDPKKLTGYLISDKDIKSTLSIKSKYFGIKELDLSCELFYIWFKGVLMCYIGAQKKQLDLTGIGLPFDINADGLLERGRQYIDKVEELKGTKSHWSNF